MPAPAPLPVLTRAFDGVVVTDIRMPDMDGLQLFQRLRDLDAEIPVILITGHGDIATAVQCMREGAYDFLAKPYPAERLIATIGHAAEKRRLVLENRRLRKRPSPRAPTRSRSSAIPRPCCGSSRRCGISPTPTWTCWWKARPAPAEVVASALHRMSRRRQHELVAINCGALPESVIESCSAMRRAPSPAPRRGASAASSMPAAARCSSMRSRACP